MTPTKTNLYKLCEVNKDGTIQRVIYSRFLSLDSLKEIRRNVIATQTSFTGTLLIFDNENKIVN